MNYEQEYRKLIEHLTYAKHLGWFLWPARFIVMWMVCGFWSSVVYGLIITIFIDFPAYCHLDNKIKKMKDYELMESISKTR